MDIHTRKGFTYLHIIIDGLLFRFDYDNPLLQKLM